MEVCLNNLKIAIVLGGGFAKGACQFGFLKSLLKYIPNENIVYISASSIGVLNGYALSSNKMPEAEHLWRTKDFGNIFNFLKKSWKEDVFSQIVNMLCFENDVLNIPLSLNMCQFPKFQELYLELNGKKQNFWNSALRASISFPVVSKKPTRFYKKYYIDGGLLDNIPIAPALNSNANLIIVLHCDARYLPIEKSYYRNKVILDVDVTAKSNGLLKTFDLRPASLNKMLNEGESYGEETAKMIFPLSHDLNFYSVRENVHNFIKYDYKNRKNKQSLDTLGTLINELYCSLFIEDSDLYKL